MGVLLCDAPLDEAQVLANMKTLLATDPYAYVDVSLIKHLTGEGGRAALQQQWECTCGPAAVDLPAACRAADVLTKSALYQMLGAAERSEIDVANGWVKSLHAKKAPTAPLQPSAWIGKVWASLPDYVLSDGGAGASGSGRTKGIPALESKWEGLKDKDVQLKDLELFATWTPWLPAALLDSVEAARTKIMEKVRSSGAIKLPGPKGKVEKVKKASSAEADAQAAVFAMLRRKSG